MGHGWDSVKRPQAPQVPLFAGFKIPTDNKVLIMVTELYLWLRLTRTMNKGSILMRTHRELQKCFKRIVRYHLEAQIH